MLRAMEFKARSIRLLAFEASEILVLSYRRTFTKIPSTDDSERCGMKLLPLVITVSSRVLRHPCFPVNLVDDCERRAGDPSRSDHHARGLSQAAGGLSEAACAAFDRG